MIVGKVLGSIWSTAKEPNLEGFRFLLVQDLNDVGTTRVMIAVDTVGAGVGDRVLVVDEGGSARQCMGSADAPVNAAAIGFVDAADGFPDPDA